MGGAGLQALLNEGKGLREGVPARPIRSGAGCANPPLPFRTGRIRTACVETLLQALRRPAAERTREAMPSGAGA